MGAKHGEHDHYWLAQSAWHAMFLLPREHRSLVEGAQLQLQLVSRKDVKHNTHRGNTARETRNIPIYNFPTTIQQMN